MKSDFFKDILKWKVERKGTTEALPFLYYDMLSIAAVYTASTPRVRKLLPHPDLHPIELVPGRCLVAIAGFEYRETDHQPYNEVNISFLVSHQRHPLPLIAVLKALSSGVIPSYVWQLPVTTEFARIEGVDLYGYPKFLADIHFEKIEGRIECTLSESGVNILRLTGRALRSKTRKTTRYLTYAVEDGILVHTNFLVNAFEFAQSQSKQDITLEIGEEHLIGQTLKDIKLSNRPMLYQYMPRGEAILFPGRNIRDV
jgi:hypothetical protein